MFVKFTNALNKNPTREFSTTVLRTNKVQIRPNVTQRKRLIEWFKVCNFAYNQTVRYLRGQSKIPARYTLRDTIRKEVLGAKFYEWAEQCKIPKRCIDDAIIDVHKAYKSAFANAHIKRFRIRYKRWSFHRQTISIPKDSFSKRYNTFAMKSLGKSLETVPKYDLSAIEHTCRLQYDKRRGRFYLFIPYDKHVTSRSCEGMIGLDPGARTFITGYDECGNFIEAKIGPRFKKYLKVTNIAREKFKNNRSYNKFVRKRYRRINNIVTDLHWKTARYLCSHYRTIKIGKLNTSSCISKTKALPKQCRKELLLLSHYTFRQRLVCKAEEFDCTVIEINEYATSMTCSKCGEHNKALGSSKKFHCAACGLAIDRDWNAAINIFRK